MDTLKTALIATVIALVVVIGFAVVMKDDGKSASIGGVPGITVLPEAAIGTSRIVSQDTTSLTATGTVRCALLSPTSTSTLIMATAGLSEATATPSSLSISKSTTAGTVGATILASTSIAANRYANLSTATTSYATNTVDLWTFGPSTYVNIAQQATGFNTFSTAGRCQALWLVH